MYWLVENKNQLEVLSNQNYKNAFIGVIPISHFNHPQENSISLIYLHPLEAHKGYMLCINHSETFNLDLQNVKGYLLKFDSLFCLNKKEILHYLTLFNIWDINITPDPLNFTPTKTHEIYYNQLQQHQKYNNFIIPIVKHYQMCEGIFNKVKPHLYHREDDYYKFFNKSSSVVFNLIEKNGIKIDNKRFGEHFYKTDKNIIHTQFNLKTLTSRPSNSFKGVNFSALNKKDDSRKSFIPKNDVFWEIDISAYHPTLIAQLIDYQFQTQDIHGFFANMYGVSYSESKHITFQQIYGGVFDKYKHLEFFQKTQKYIDKLFKHYQDKGYIKVPISGYKISKDVHGEMKKQKLFNYFLQSLETSKNVIILKEIIKLLIYYNTQIILYTYDSFTFDFDINEKEILNKIREVFKKYNLKIKEKYGYDYKFTK